MWWSSHTDVADIWQRCFKNADSGAWRCADYGWEISAGFFFMKFLSAVFGEICVLAMVRVLFQPVLSQVVARHVLACLLSSLICR